MQRPRPPVFATIGFPFPCLSFLLWGARTLLGAISSYGVGREGDARFGTSVSRIIALLDGKRERAHALDSREGTHSQMNEHQIAGPGDSGPSADSDPSADPQNRCRIQQNGPQIIAECSENDPQIVAECGKTTPKSLHNAAE